MAEHECDLLLFVATTTELKQLHAAADERRLQFEPVNLGDDHTRKSYWLGEIGTHRTIAVKTEMGGLGYGGSAASGFHFMSRTRATKVLCLGMAFGVSPSYQSFGDVLVADAVFPYDDRDVVVAGNGWEYSYPERATMYPSSRELLKILESQRNRVLDPGFQVTPGCLLTGNALIRSEVYREDIVRWASRIATSVVGGEMEGLGLLSLAPRDKPNWMIVKGICDFADGQQANEGKANRDLACKNAASFVLDALASWTPGTG